MDVGNVAALRPTRLGSRGGVFAPQTFRSSLQADGSMSAVRERGSSEAEDRPVTETTYGERLATLLRRNDPRMMFVGRKQVEESIQVMSEAAAAPGGVSAERLAKAEVLVAATAHPSGYMIPAPLRTSAFAWMNMPLVITMLGATEAWQLVFLQLVNQAYNACFNLANGAQGASGVRRRIIFRNFAVASVVSCLIAVVGVEVANVLNIRNPMLRWIVPYLSVVSADIVNLVFARIEELTDGVMLSDVRGHDLGVKSRAAGRAAVMKALLTRSLLMPLLALLAPTFIGMVPWILFPQWASPTSRVMVDLVIILATLWAGLPACMALFPGTLRMPLRQLEKEVQREVLLASPTPPDAVYVYRGL